MMDKHRHGVLLVDDEKNILNALKRLLRKEGYNIYTAHSGSEGIKVLDTETIHVVISDQRMPEMSGTDFLAEVKARHPDVMRIILTGYTDVDSITESINKGNIYKFFLKPWNDQNLKLEVRQALEQYDLIAANRQLHEKVLEQNEELKAINENLEQMVNQRTETLNIQNRALELSHAILEDLPFPIIGISADHMIVMTNDAANRLFDQTEGLCMGTQIKNVFPESVCRQIETALSENRQLDIDGWMNGRSNCKVGLKALTGRHAGKGLIMCFHENPAEANLAG